MAKKDIIKFLSSDSREKLSGLTPDMLEVGELALITETDYERLYCKNVNDEIVPIHRILNAGEIVAPFIAEPCTFTTTGTSQNVRLINKQEYAKKITLEDGTDVPITGTGALNYTFAEAGDHKVTIEFKEDVTHFYECFYNCRGLTSIPEKLFSNCPNVTNFGYCFSGCTSLTSIPENLFANNTAVTNFSYCFQNCTGLTGSIPENLFANNTAVISFGNCFCLCRGLTSIPENLFANNTAVTIFFGCFRYCSGLTGSIPENLFKYNTAVTNFGYCFSDCEGLTSIPENLFANNTAVTNFSYCFYGCSGLTGKVPVDNDGTPIYNRSGEGKEGYAIVTNYSGCFRNCSGLTDYSSIPSSWGGGGA